jgi:hypothetical protein
MASRKPLGSRNKPKPSKDSDDDDEAIKYVRGGSICNPDEKGAHLIRGSGSPASCRATPGGDPRPRWRVAGR